MDHESLQPLSQNNPPSLQNAFFHSSDNLNPEYSHKTHNRPDHPFDIVYLQQLAIGQSGHMDDFASIRWREGY